MSVTALRKFFSIVRTEFSCLEADDGPNPDFTIMDAFYESIYRQNYPFWRGCGYWNVFVDFELQWDSYDNLFSLTLARRKQAAETTASKVVHLGEILAVVHSQWPADWRAFDANDGTGQVQMYAKAARAHAHEIFIPCDREAEGLEGFSWYAGVMTGRTIL